MTNNKTALVFTGAVFILDKTLKDEVNNKMPKGKETEWRIVDGFERYGVNANGEVIRFGYMASNHGAPYYREASLLKVGSALRRGYPVVSLYNEKEHKTVNIHRLVAQAFVPNPEGKLEINHKDGDKTNCKASNLEWCTSSENKRHAIATGLIKTGCAHKLSKLTIEQVRDIKQNCVTSKRGYSQMDFARKYGVSRGCIKDLLYGRTYKYGEAVCL